MVVFCKVHARVLKTSTREDVIPGLVECIRRSAESGSDVTRVKSDLWSHLTLLIDPYYLSFRDSATCSVWCMSLDKSHYTLHIYVPVCLNIAVYVAGKAVTRLRDCSALTIARHLSSVEEVDVLGLPSPLVPEVKAWVAWVKGEDD